MAAGTQNSAVIAFGVTGNPGTIWRCTEQYNGTAWSVGNAAPTPNRCIPAGGGSSSAGLSAGGSTPSPTLATTSEFTSGPASPGTPDSYIIGTGSISV